MPTKTSNAHFSPNATKHKINRRNFTKLIVGSSFAVASPWVRAARGPKIVIVGGGIGGTSVARYLLDWLPSSSIILIEPSHSYITPFSTNHFLGGFNKISAFTYNYQSLIKSEKINVIHDSVVSVDPDKKIIRLNQGNSFTYDALILSTGVQLKFDSIDGYDRECAELFPHAYHGSSSAQWVSLRQRIVNMKDGGLIAISVPRRPYRCTPAPYERASLIAKYLNLYKPRSKLLILDSKNEFPLMDLILDSWNNSYGDLIEWVSADFGGAIQSINKKSGALKSDDEAYFPDVANIIPMQAASHIAMKSGLTDRTGWCPVNGSNLESIIAPNIYLLGDTIDAGDMPKSASAALSQAQRLSIALQLKFTGNAGQNSQLKNSCFFFIAPDRAVVIGGEYRVYNKKIVGVKGYSSDIGDDSKTLYKNAKNAHAWYKNIAKKIFQ